MLNLRHRSPLKEIMDLEIRSDRETFQAYDLIRLVNRYLGGTKTILSHLKRFAKNWPQGKFVKILDVGSGACDIPQSIIDWARKNNYKIKITALDLSSQSMAYARKHLIAYPEIELVEADILQHPFQKGEFDYSISSLFFHHLSDEQIPKVLHIMDQLSTRGIMINDLLRRHRAYLWIYFFSRFTSNDMFRQDAPLSVLRGFKHNDIKNWKLKTGLDYLKFYEHFGHRFALAGEKSA